MKWWKYAEFQKMLEDIVFKLYDILKEKYPSIKLSTNIIKTIFDYYLETAYRLQAGYTNVNSKEKKKFLSDVYFRAIYMTMKGVDNEDDLSRLTKDINLRDQIWIVLSEIQRTCANDPTYNKFWNPYSYQYAIAKKAVETPKASPIVIPTAPPPKKVVAPPKKVVAPPKPLFTSTKKSTVMIEPKKQILKTTSPGQKKPEIKKPNFLTIGLIAAGVFVIFLIGKGK